MMVVQNIYNSYNSQNSIQETKYISKLRFKKTICFFYDCCIKRVNNSRLKNNLKQYEICNSGDKAIVSNFFNGKCTNNNPYLITQKLIGYNRGKKKYAKNESGESIGIIHTLGFKSAKEILWGKDDEISQNLLIIFMLLMQEIPIYCPQYIDDIEMVLFDYIPYSKYKTLSDIKKKYAISLFDAYGVFDEEVTELKLFQHRQNAINFLFYKSEFRSDLLKAFNDFADKQTSFTKIDEKLEKDFIIPKFMHLLKKHRPRHETSLGIRVKDLLNNDLSTIPKLFSTNIKENPNMNDSQNLQLIKASSRYITDLEKIQKEHFGFLFE